MGRGDRARGLQDERGNSARRMQSNAERLRTDAVTLHQQLQELYSRWSARRRRRGSLACAVNRIVNRLLRKYREFDTLLTQDFVTESGVVDRLGDGGSPLLGATLDIFPFSERDSWVVIQNQVRPFCQEATEEPPPPPPPPPPPSITEVDKPIPDPDPLPPQLDGALRSILEAAFRRLRMEQRGVFSDSHDVRAMSKLTLFLVNLQRIASRQQVAVCSEAAIEENKNIARFARTVFMRILQQFPESRNAEIEPLIRRVIHANIDRWLELYINTSDPGIRASARSRILHTNLGCGQMLIPESRFEEELPGHSLLDGV